MALLSRGGLLPALPLLVVLGVGAVRELPWSWKHVVLVAALTVAFAVTLNQAPDDGPYWRRLLILRGTLAFGGGALILGGIAHTHLARAWRHAAAIAAAAALACGIAVTMLIDFRVTRLMQGEHARKVDHFALLTPQRFALVGWASDIDTVLALRATRDVEYIDLTESDGWLELRQMIDRWSNDRRPIFAVLPSDVRSPWMDVAFDLVDAHDHVYRISKRAP